MYGAFLGDMIGAPYEFDRGGKTKDFPLFSKYSRFTDDSVMTTAVCEALLEAKDGDVETIKEKVIESMRYWGEMCPHAGYGGMFRRWLVSDDPTPYGSYGNGSAMRVSSVGWLYDTIERTREVARATAEVTHNHPEGIKGAEAVASAIFLAREGGSKEEIKDYIVRNFNYDLSRTCAQIRPSYRHDESCQRTVPEAITAFLEGRDFVDVIRTAVSLGGDCDTLTCIAGSMAEAYYGVPARLKVECVRRISRAMQLTLNMLVTSRRMGTERALSEIADYCDLFREMKAEGEPFYFQEKDMMFPEYCDAVECMRMDLYNVMNNNRELCDYWAVMEKYGYQANCFFSTPIKEVATGIPFDSFGEDFIIAALFSFERGERFTGGGTIAEALDSGLMIKLLERLKQLTG